MCEGKTSVNVDNFINLGLLWGLQVLPFMTLEQINQPGVLSRSMEPMDKEGHRHPREQSRHSIWCASDKCFLRISKYLEFWLTAYWRFILVANISHRITEGGWTLSGNVRNLRLSLCRRFHPSPSLSFTYLNPSFLIFVRRRLEVFGYWMQTCGDDDLLLRSKVRLICCIMLEIVCQPAASGRRFCVRRCKELLICAAVYICFALITQYMQCFLHA